MNKAFIAFLWVATALLTYWLGLEQGLPPIIPKLVRNYCPAILLDSQQKEGKPPQSPKHSPVWTSTNILFKNELVAVEPDLEEERGFQHGVLICRRESSPRIRLFACELSLNFLEDGSPQSIEQAKEIYEKLPEGPQLYELRCF